MNDTSSQLEQLASRAVTLYSRPTVAMELVRLAEEPRVDAQALKECVAQDPALTCKVLRVVNSSLFGLQSAGGRPEPGDRAAGHQAAQAAGAGIQSAGRAVCRSGGARAAMVLDEHADARRRGAHVRRAAVAPAGRRGVHRRACCRTSASWCCCASWASRTRSFLTGVIDEKCHLASLEQDTLGFDHIQLSAALLARWQLPQRLVDAIAAPKRHGPTVADVAAGRRPAANPAPGRNADAARRPAAAAACCPTCSKRASCIAE